MLGMHKRMKHLVGTHFWGLSLWSSRGGAQISTHKPRAAVPIHLDITALPVGTGTALHSEGEMLVPPDGPQWPAFPQKGHAHQGTHAHRIIACLAHGGHRVPQSHPQTLHGDQCGGLGVANVHGVANTRS